MTVPESAAKIDVLSKAVSTMVIRVMSATMSKVVSTVMTVTAVVGNTVSAEEIVTSV